MLRSRLDSIAASMDEEMDSAIRNLAERIVVNAKARVPVSDLNKPHLRDAIHLERDGDGNYRVIAGNSELFYGHLVEFGSAGGGRGRGPIPPRPFLLPALEMARAAVDDEVKRALKDL